MQIKENYTIQEFFADKKIIIEDLNKLSLEQLFKYSLKNQSFINELISNSEKKNGFLINYIIQNANRENEFCLLSNKIKLVSFTILISAIFSTLYNREEINSEHHKIFKNILKEETLYHIELQNSDNNFFKDFIVNRNPRQMHIQLSNLSRFLQYTFYHFEQELHQMTLREINNLLSKITNYKLHIQQINLN